jgi:carbonic anhydrase
LKSNQSFVDGEKLESFLEYLEWQHPWITTLYCCDSRVQSTILLKAPTNQIFTIQSIGNAIKNSEASLDYWIYHLHTPILLIMWHSDCGAIKACRFGYENEKNDSIKKGLDNINEAFKDWKWESLKDDILKNINYQISIALEKYKDLIKSKKLLILWAYYDFANDFNLWYWRIILTNINGSINKLKDTLQQIIPNFPIWKFAL